MRAFITCSLLIALAGCNDTGVTAYNANPEATITSHADGDEVFEGMTVSFRGSVSDPDDATSSLTTTWYLGTEEACAAETADTTGVTSCDIAIGIDDTEITLEVTDPGSASGSASLTLTVVPTESPDVTILLPDPSGTFYADQLITFEGLVSDGEDAAADLAVWWESSIDGVVDVDSDPNADGEVLGFAYLGEGEHALTIPLPATSTEMASTLTVTDMIVKRAAMAVHILLSALRPWIEQALTHSVPQWGMTAF